MILLIDNYDSFTYNIVQYIQQLGHKVEVRRHDHISIEEIAIMAPDFILLSPGPGNPDKAGICLEIVNAFHQTVPILGICLGHQVIAQSFGGFVKKAAQPMHGKVSSIHHDGQGIFCGLPSPFSVARYHSLIVDKASLPACLDISATSTDGQIMAIRHRFYPVEGVQFHPEAILTEHGLQLLENFFSVRSSTYVKKR